MIFNVNSGGGKTPINVVPDTLSAFTYDGSAKTPLWQNFDPDQLTIGGVTSAIDAGSYTVFFTPKSDFEWWDGTTTPKEVTWRIAKASYAISLSATSGTITGKNNSLTFQVVRSGDGEISVWSNNGNIATTSLSGSTVTVTATGHEYGTTTITIGVYEGTNHLAPEHRTYTITVNPLHVHLYNHGDNCAWITGGWESRISKYDGIWFAEHNGDGFLYINRYQASEGLVCTRAPIDLSKYTKIYINTHRNSGGSWCFGVMPTNNTLRNYSAFMEIPSGINTSVLDISHVNSGYICFDTAGQMDSDYGYVATPLIYLE